MPTPNKPKKRARRPKETGGLWQMPKKMCCALILTMALGTLLLLPVTAILLATDDPAAMMRPAALCLSFLTALFGGMIAAKISRGHSPVLFAAALGVLLALLYLVASLFLPDGWVAHPMGGISHLARALLIPATMLGALLATRKKKAKRYHH